MDDVASWHHGVVAQWWDEFNQGGPEIDYVRDHITRSGEPVLDVACGTGLLLLPYLRAATPDSTVLVYVARRPVE